MMQKNRIFCAIVDCLLLMGVFNTKIYGKLVWHSFKSFEQCIYRASPSTPSDTILSLLLSKTLPSFLFLNKIMLFTE